MIETFDTRLDHQVTKEVLYGDCYPEVPMTGAVETVVDIGANVGAASMLFAKRWPKARILAFEPSIQAMLFLQKNVTGLPVTTYDYGLSDFDGSMPLYTGTDSSVTNSIKQSGLNGKDFTLVKICHAGKVFRKMQIPSPDVLKIDTEGCEVQILQALEEYLLSVGIVYLEYHCAADRLEIDDLLSFTHWLCRGEITDLHRGELAYVNKKRIPDGSDWMQIKASRRVAWQSVNR